MVDLHCSFLDASQLPGTRMLVVDVCKKPKDHQVGAHKILKFLWVHQVEFTRDVLKGATLWHKWCVDVDLAFFKKKEDWSDTIHVGMIHKDHIMRFAKFRNV